LSCGIKEARSCGTIDKRWVTSEVVVGHVNV
jgi:hypothetical protein